MSPEQQHLMRRVRRHVGEAKRSLALFEAKLLRVYHNGQDVSDQHVAMLKDQIAHNEEVLAQYDPDGLTVDGDVALGQVDGLLAGVLTPGRPITYSVDADGEVTDLRVFGSDEEAARDAASGSGRIAGWISQDGWSIRTAIER